MFEQSLLKLFVLLFAFLTWYRFRYSVFFLFLLLPTYLIRFKIFTIPSTLLEGMFFIILLIWIAKIWVNNDFKNKFSELKNIFKKHKTLIYAAALFLSGATISVFTSIDMKSALGEWKAFYVEPFILFIFLILYIKEKKQLHSILFAVILSGLITSALAIYQHFTGWMVPWEFWENKNTFRVTGWYGFPNGVGLFLAPIFPLALYLIQNKWGEMKSQPEAGQPLADKIFDLIILIFSLLFIFLSPLAIFFAKSTGGLVGVVAGVGLLLLFNKKTRWPAIVMTIVSLVSLVSSPGLSGLKNEVFLQDRSGQLRLNMWAETIEFLSDHPLTGAGLASYKTLIYPYRIDKWIEVFHHPHNIFLTIWVNVGLLGLIGFVWILVWFFRVALSCSIYHITYNRLTLFLLSSMTIFIVTGFVDSPYIKNDMAILFWLLPALMIFESKLTQDIKHR